MCDEKAESMHHHEGGLQPVDKEGTTLQVWTFFGLEKEGTNSNKVY